MKVRVTTANGKILGTMVLSERPYQGEHISLNGNVFEIGKIIHEQNANFAFTVQAKVSY